MGMGLWFREGSQSRLRGSGHLSGDAWSLPGTLANFSVSAGSATMTAPLGNTRTAALNAVSTTSADVTVKLAANRPDAGSTYISVLGRRTNATSDYRAKVRFFTNGDVTSTLVRFVDGVETTVGGGRVPGLTYNSNDALKVRLQVFGFGPTALKGKVRRASDAEPTTWTYQGSDSTLALQVPGGIGLQAYTSNTTGNSPAVASFGDLAAFPVAG